MSSIWSKVPRRLVHASSILRGNAKEESRLVEGEIPREINFGRIRYYAQLCENTNRKERNPDHSEKALVQEAESIRAVARDMGMQDATVIQSDDVEVLVLFREDPAQIDVAFSGSNKDRAHFLRNINIRNMEPSGFGEEAKVHPGFNGSLDKPAMRALDTHIENKPTSVWEDLEGALEYYLEKSPDAHVTFTGHSAGGALAMIAASRWLGDEKKPERKIDQIISFGQPRTGNAGFRDALQGRVGIENILRVELDGDPVPALPIRNEKTYLHCGTWLPFNRDGKILERSEAETKTYEDTNAYSSGDRPADMKQGNIRHTTENWRAFMNSDKRKNHLLDAYFGGLDKLAEAQAKEMGRENLGRARFHTSDFLTDDKFNTLLLMANTLQDELEGAHVNDAEASEGFKSTKNAFERQMRDWPRHLHKQVAKQMQNAISDLLEDWPSGTGNEPFNSAKSLADQFLSTLKSYRLDIGVGEQTSR